MRKLNKEEIIAQANMLFEESSQEERDFLEVNIDEIANALLANNATEEDIHDLLQEECERYSEYLELE